MSVFTYRGGEPSFPRVKVHYHFECARAMFGEQKRGTISTFYELGESVAGFDNDEASMS